MTAEPVSNRDRLYDLMALGRARALDLGSDVVMPSLSPAEAERLRSDIQRLPESAVNECLKHYEAKVNQYVY